MPSPTILLLLVLVAEGKGAAKGGKPAACPQLGRQALVVLARLRCRSSINGTSRSILQIPVTCDCVIMANSPAQHVCSLPLRFKLQPYQGPQMMPWLSLHHSPDLSRQDLSAQHAYLARQAFSRCVAKGETGVNLAEAALHISSEDDALGKALGHMQACFLLISWPAKPRIQDRSLVATMACGDDNGVVFVNNGWMRRCWWLPGICNWQQP